ncbi:hypothetical protein GGR57DRAFT_100274 [Xylariaceae sp. FL1272]|nr:hypothetical protein GGR57DRAFT_100274 [Xylariaceae sp. FL1272]
MHRNFFPAAVVCQLWLPVAVRPVLRGLSSRPAQRVFGFRSQYRQFQQRHSISTPPSRLSETEAHRDVHRKTGTKASYDETDVLKARFKDVQCINTKASRRGGRHALDVLQSLDELDGYVMVWMGLQCLESYRIFISACSIEEAKELIKSHSAGKRVLDWTSRPLARHAIESNHMANRRLLDAVAYIVVGSSELSQLEAWMKSTPAERRTHDMRPTWSTYAWKSRILAGILMGIFRWDTQQTANAAFDYFSDFVELRHRYSYHGGFLDHIGLAIPSLVLGKVLTSVTDPECYERAIPHLIELSKNGCKRRLEEAKVWLSHPTKPDANYFLELLKNVDSDPNHVLRRGYNMGNDTAKSGRFLNALALKADSILHSEGRYTEARWISDFARRTWGPDSSYEERYQRHKKTVDWGAPRPWSRSATSPGVT